MLSKQKIKVIKSLSQKKYRQKLGLFVVEGVKSISEFLNSNFELEQLYTTASVFENALQENIVEISENDLKKITNLKNPNVALAVFKIPEVNTPNISGLTVALDAVNDPGNLGTIIRLCDWFNVTTLLCSQNTVDCYNPKVVQSTMGSLTRVNVNYLDLEAFLNNSKIETYGTFMNGDNIYTSNLPKNGIIVLGNEANGISTEVETLVNHRISIPQFGELKSTESLNVANATAIILSEFCRQTTEM